MSSPFKSGVRRISGLFAALALRLASRPYRPHSGGALVVAPHADDETLGCGGLIAAQVRANRQVDIAFLTDSAASHAGHPTLVSSELAVLRRAEALEALSILGLQPRHAHFFDLPDGALERLDAGVLQNAEARLTELIRRLGPAEVFVTWRGDGSTEHAAASLMTERALAWAGGGTLMEYPVWAWWDPRRLARRLGGRADNLRLVLGSLRDLKLRALGSHRSQVSATPPWTRTRIASRSVAVMLRTGGVLFSQPGRARTVRPPLIGPSPSTRPSPTMIGVLNKITDRLIQKWIRDPAGFGRPVPVEALDREYRSGNWDSFFSLDELPRNLVLAGAVHHFFPRPAVLDIGCGSGRLAQAFSVYPFSRYVGVDVSAEGLERARGLGLDRVEWTQGDYETWRPKGRFDAIVLNECIGYARDSAAILLAFAPHLTQDGRFFLSYYRSGSYAAQWRRMDKVAAVEFSTSLVSRKGQTWDVKILRPRA